MDAFSYLSVLLSVIIGLGISQLLTALGRLVRHRDVVRFYSPPLIWACVLLLIFIQSWWAMFVLRHYTAWTFLAFTVVLLQTIALYMVAAVVLPEGVDETGVDLRLHYENHRRWIFGFLLAALATSVVKDVILYGRLAEPANLAFHALFAVACVTVMLMRLSRAHEIVAVISALAMGAYVTILFAQLH